MKEKMESKLVKIPVSVLKKENAALKADYTNLAKIHESSMEEMLSMIEELQLKNEVLAKDNEEKTTLLTKIIATYNDLVDEWNASAKWTRFFIALKYLQKFFAIFSKALQTEQTV